MRPLVPCVDALGPRVKEILSRRFLEPRVDQLSLARRGVRGPECVVELWGRRSCAPAGAAAAEACVHCSAVSSELARVVPGVEALQDVLVGLLVAERFGWRKDRRFGVSISAFDFLAQCAPFVDGHSGFLDCSQECCGAPSAFSCGMKDSGRVGRQIERVAWQDRVRRGHRNTESNCAAGGGRSPGPAGAASREPVFDRARLLPGDPGGDFRIRLPVAEPFGWQQRYRTLRRHPQCLPRLAFARCPFFPGHADHLRTFAGFTRRRPSRDDVTPGA